MNTDLLCVLLVWCTSFNILFLIVSIFIFISRSKDRRDKLQLEQLRLNFEYKPSEDDFTIIDNLIETNLAEYRILKLEHVEKLYINEDIQKKIFEYVLRKVMYQLSPLYIQRLSYIYNKDRLDEIIAQKINMHILNYTIEVNGSIREKK